MFSVSTKPLLRFGRSCGKTQQGALSAHQWIHSRTRPAVHRKQPSPSSLCCASISTSTSTSPNISSGTRLDAIQADLNLLTGPSGKWTLAKNGAALERSFKFKSFRQAWAFMSATAEAAAKAKHHPEWSNVYNRVLVRWTTHNPAGLSDKDVQLARACTELALRKESLAIEDEAGASADLACTIDAVVKGAGDCCGTAEGKLQTQQEIKARVEEEESEGAGSAKGIGGQPS